MYARAKRTVYNLVKDDASGVAASIFDFSIIALIAINILLVVLDTFSGLPPRVLVATKYIETFSIIIFTAEYLMRLWVADLARPRLNTVLARVRYAVSFLALVDLLSILPFYLPLLFPIDLRVLRVLRLFRLVRIFKINRYTTALTSIVMVIKRKASQLISSFAVVLLLMLVSSILMYGLEHEAQPAVFQNAFSGMWWAIATLTTVGYGDIYPITALGRVLSSVIALLGIGLVAVPTGIISAGFVETMQKDVPPPAPKLVLKIIRNRPPAKRGKKRR